MAVKGGDSYLGIPDNPNDMELAKIMRNAAQALDNASPEDVAEMNRDGTLKSTTKKIVAARNSAAKLDKKCGPV